MSASLAIVGDDTASTALGLSVTPRTDYAAVGEVTVTIPAGQTRGMAH